MRISVRGFHMDWSALFGGKQRDSRADVCVALFCDQLMAKTCTRVARCFVSRMRFDVYFHVLRCVMVFLICEN